MADLKVDWEQLDVLRYRLDRALEVINEDSDIANELGDAVGHHGLQSVIEAFSASWRKHRLDIRDNLTWMRDSVDKIGVSFEDTDDALANALTAPPAPTASSSGPVAV